VAISCQDDDVVFLDCRALRARNDEIYYDDAYNGDAIIVAFEKDNGVLSDCRASSTLAMTRRYVEVRKLCFRTPHVIGCPECGRTRRCAVNARTTA
jgi:hypothetical protein